MCLDAPLRPPIVPHGALPPPPPSPPRFCLGGKNTHTRAHVCALSLSLYVYISPFHSVTPLLTLLQILRTIDFDLNITADDNEPPQTLDVWRAELKLIIHQNDLPFVNFGVAVGDQKSALQSRVLHVHFEKRIITWSRSGDTMHVVCLLSVFALVCLNDRSSFLFFHLSISLSLSSRLPVLDVQTTGIHNMHFKKRTRETTNG